MGREIRRVPPHWEHPRDSSGNHVPLFDKDVGSAWEEWLSTWEEWLRCKHAEHLKKYPDSTSADPYTACCEWHGQPPDPDRYRPHWDEGTATWWQVYETVSEGTPVSPPFATREELVKHLIAHGDDWDQRRGNSGWPRQRAEVFVQNGMSVPSMVLDSRGLHMGAEVLDKPEEK